MSKNNKEVLLLILTLLLTLIVFGGGGLLIWTITKSPQPPDTPPDTPDTSDTSDTSDDRPSRILGKIFTDVPDVPEGVFNYGGSTTWAPIREELDSLLPVVFPQFKLRYVNPINEAPGSGTGIKMLIEGQLDFSQSSRSIKPEEYEEAKARGFTLRQTAVAIDGIAIAVHPDLPVSGITISQLEDIYTGKITNWREVGGPNLPIQVYSRDPEAGGTVEFFIDTVLRGESLGSRVEIVETTTLALRKVANNLGGIYYASAPEVVPQCTVKTLALGKNSDELVTPYRPPLILPAQCPTLRNKLNQTAFSQRDYLLTRQLYVIIKENEQREQQAGEAYADLLLTNQGQDYIAEAGFVKIRD